jgi:MoaA/NifB/PqqE/SkfB family radical SAM enzyme
MSNSHKLFRRRLRFIYRRFRELRMIAYLLSPDRVERLNRAGLDHMQISIDNVIPDEVSKKSLKVMDRKLRHLAAHAEFGVNINSIIAHSNAAPRPFRSMNTRAKTWKESFIP